MRLGEMLLAHEMIDERQLKAALDAQLIYGGHLGTCLIELGYLDVETLGNTLSQSFKVNHVHRETIENLPSQIVGVLPKRLVERHCAVPFQLNDNVLHVAMIDPRNLLALDELSFASGYRVEAWVAPEVVIVHAMERHYGVARKLRHIRLSGQPQRPGSERKRQSVAVAEEPKSRVETPPASKIEETPPPRDSFVVQELPEYQRDPGKTAAWIKVRKPGEETEAWSHLFDVDLNHEHFEDAEGVYVVWHHGRNPVLRVGQGLIRHEIETLLDAPDVIEIGQETVLYVTWAKIDDEERDGVERYLAEMLDPQIAGPLPDAESIEVNLPPLGVVMFSPKG